MSNNRKSYPLSENHADELRASNGFHLDDLTIENILNDKVTMADIQIAPETLSHQAEIAGAAKRYPLADNFWRAAEMTSLPNELIMEIYEMLRPGRALDRSSLDACAERLRNDFGAEKLALFLEEAAEIYTRHGVFSKRF
ncbi:MAG: diol dehydratase small subunit [Proteobacteria bacterium]|jgi:propanediol dehydratase small subunit|nr:diol dehydratase small subunit [Pseudomonadota bacterium]MDA0846312.1 diol dehydratase small subunit [Pseudomonadota bacterium]